MPQFIKCGPVSTLKQARRVLEMARGLKKYYALSKTLRREAVKLLNVVRTVGDAVDMAKASTVTQVEGVWGRYYFQHSRQVLGVKFTYYTNSEDRYVHLLVEDRIHTPFHKNTSYRPYALRCAKEAWRQQDKVKALTTRGLAKLAVSFLHLVTPEDSIKAGNCAPGTAAWMERHGVKNSITLRGLLKHAGDPRVARVLAHVANS